MNRIVYKATKKCRTFDWAVNQEVLKRSIKPNKLGVRSSGPYSIEQAHTNNTKTISPRKGVTECINIRRVIPYCKNI